MYAGNVNLWGEIMNIKTLSDSSKETDLEINAEKTSIMCTSGHRNVENIAI